jgi:hypothetical protein
MHLRDLLFIVFCHLSFAILHIPYPKQTFELPNHPLNWVCTVHVTVATFASKASSDITERFLVSNREKIIPTLSTMRNRSIRIVPVISFYESCTVSVFIDATIRGSSYLFKTPRWYRYFNGNGYIYRGWRHSLIILIYFSCYPEYKYINFPLPHRLFYHSLYCGHQNIFPNQVFVPDPLYKVWNINDPTHNIHNRPLPLSIKRSVSTPKYGWNRLNRKIKPDHCLASRWDKLSQMAFCALDVIAVHHYQHFLNFTAVVNARDERTDYGKVLTDTKQFHLTNAISVHAIDSMNVRILYCDRNSESPRLRPIHLSSPFSLETWATLVFLLIFCAIVSSFTIFDLRSFSNNWTSILFIKTVFNGLFELIMCLIEKDVGKKTCTKAFIGLIAVCLGDIYKNYLTIDLVFPRAGAAISNFTELLDLSFHVIERVNVKDIGLDKSLWLKIVNFDLEIDEAIREKYVREVEMWLKFIPYNEEKLYSELVSVTSKNAFILNAPYFMQVYSLNLLRQRNYPLSCHFVKRPFAHKFRELYFLNPKAEEFKWWTAKFLDHGLFEFWKRLHRHQLTLYQRYVFPRIRSKKFNPSSTKAFDFHNFIGQVHLILFYIVISTLTAISVAIFLLECLMQKARHLSLLVLTKLTHFSLQLLCTIVRFLYLMSRFIRSCTKVTILDKYQNGTRAH